MYRKLLIAICLIFATAAAHAAEPASHREDLPFLESWFRQEEATGDWYGLRNKLDDRGITISSNYTTDIGGNPVGGLNQVVRYSGFLDVSVTLDLEKIVSLKGVALSVGNYWASGRNLSEAIGNFFLVQEIYVPGNYFLGEIELSLESPDETMTVEVGRLFAGDVFATSDLWKYYVNAGINSNMNSISANIFFPSFNIAAWATRVNFQPNREWHLDAAIYDANPRVFKNDNHGACMSFEMDSGYLAMGQLSYKHHQRPEDNGNPGSTTFGCYYQSSRFQDLTDPTKRWHGNYGYYFIFDQMLFRGDWPVFEGPDYMSSDATNAQRIEEAHGPRTAVSADRPKGLTAWFAAYIAPQVHINTQAYQIASGLTYQGLPLNRDHDVTAFCVILGKFSDQLDGQGIETVLELNHRFQISQWLYVTPDIQYIIEPNGRSGIDDALVLGVEISTNF